MMEYLAQNGLGGEAIVWLIIAFFWVVAQLFGRAKEKMRSRELTESDDADEPVPAGAQHRRISLEEEMRQFLEQMGIEPDEPEFVEEARPVPPPVPRRARPRGGRPSPPAPPIPDRPPAVPLPSPVQTAIQKQESLAYHDSSLGEMDTRIDDSVLDTDNAYAIREQIRDDVRNAFVDPRTLLVNLNYLRMNIPIVPITGLAATSERRPRPRLYGRKALREAITMQLILSNPLAMGEDKGSYTKRMV
jgi:hypothetical protein